MNLSKKKKLVERTFGVGKERVILVESRLKDIKEAITKQDVRDLYKEGAIMIKEKYGRKKKKEKNRRRKIGSIKKRLKKRKKEYMALTRKLRKYLAELKKQGKISKLDIEEMRKRIRNRAFKSKKHFQEYIRGIER